MWALFSIKSKTNKYIIDFIKLSIYLIGLFFLGQCSRVF